MRLLLKLLLVVCASGVALCQGSTTYIYDSAGNQTTVAVNRGNVYLYDSQGRSATGAIRNGSIYMNGANGEYTFGTYRNGNVFLTDQAGNTTGTIRNGSIFLNNGDGSVTTGSYDSFGHVFTTTTPSPQQLRQLRELQQQQQQLDQERQQQANQQSYENGRRIGEAIGGAINGAVATHKITKYCNNNPTGDYVTLDGITIECPQAPLSNYEDKVAASYCGDHPGMWIEFGRHRVDCNVPPSPPNLTWAKWELKEWQRDFRYQAKAKMHNSSDQIKANSENWAYWKNTYCQLSSARATYKDLQNRKQSCN